MNYPMNWERTAQTRDGVAFRIRPVRPDDADRDRRFIADLSPESRYMRMMFALKEVPDELLHRFVHVDYVKNMAFVAVVGDGSDERIIGVARYFTDSTASAEFAVVISDQWQARGVGAILTKLLFEYAAEHGIHQLHGDILSSNSRMLELVHHLGMTTHFCPEDHAVTQAERQVS